MSKNNPISRNNPLDSASFAPVLPGERGAAHQGRTPLFLPRQQYLNCRPLVATEDNAIRKTAGRGLSLFVVSSEIEALAHRVRRLTVSHRAPERFHIDRSEIAHALHCLARSLNHQQQRG